MISAVNIPYVRACPLVSMNCFVTRLIFPKGFGTQRGFCLPTRSGRFISTFQRLPFREFEFRGFLGKRRTVSFGWRYDFNVRELQQAETMPTFLLPLRTKATEFVGLPESRLQHALITEYSNQERRSAGTKTVPNLQM